MLERCPCLCCLSDRKERTSHGPMEWFLLPDFTTRTKWIGWNDLSAILHAGKARTLKLKISPVLGRFQLDLESEFGKGFRHRVLKIIIKLNKLSLQFRTCKINCQNWGFYFIDLKKEEHNAKEQYYICYFGCRSQDRAVSVITAVSHLLFWSAWPGQNLISEHRGITQTTNFATHFPIFLQK